MENEQTTMVTTQETTVDDSSTVTTESVPEASIIVGKNGRNETRG